MQMPSAARYRSAVRAAILIQFGLLAFFIAGSHNAFTQLPRPTTTDFSSFYAAGVLADRGEAPAAYDLAAHRAAEEHATAPGIDYKYFLNPPVFLLICAPLAKLPYLVAFVLFEAVTFAFWLSVTTRIAGGGRLAALTLAAVPASYWVLGWGQNSFLSAGLMGVGTLLLRRRPFLGGLALGALCFKPHFGVLIPIALLCGRQWRAVMGATLSVAGLVSVSTIVFGTQTWRGFIDMALHARDTIESGKIQFAGHIDPGGAARLLGAGAGTGWAIQAAAGIASACIVGCIWWKRRERPDGYEVRMAVLIAGTMVAMPFLLFYDLVMASVAAAWLVAAARRLGWRPGEMRTLAWAMAITLLAFPAAGILHLAIGCAVAPLLLWLALRRWLRPAAGSTLPARFSPSTAQPHV